MTEVFLALGSNMGDRPEFLRQALTALAPHVDVSHQSSVYESEPMYVGEQPHFLNMVVRGETELQPMELLTHTQAIERSLGRSPETHNKPRPIDIDIVFYGDLVLNSPELSIPHPRMHERPFVIVPLAEIAPLKAHPVHGTVVADLEDALGTWSDTMWLADEQL